MTSDSRVSMHKGAAALIGLALLMAGAGTSYLLVRSRGADSGRAESTSAGASSAAPMPDAGAAATAPPDPAPLPDAVVSLTPEAVARAGIVTAPAGTGTSGGDIRLPGVVEPNAYRLVAVTPLVGGRLTRVSAELGAHVRRGQALAEIYSPELAEAQRAYVSARAMLDAHDRALQRTGKLVEIGAASRQELERISAEHAAQTAAVQSARSQLELLGLTAPAIDALASGTAVNATTRVPAPIDGIVTERAANVGLNVDPSTKLFTVVDLSTVWVVADVYERDLSGVRVGRQVAVTTAAYPGQVRRGRISYMDPQMNLDTRTAKVRVEVPNPRGELRLGMYADVTVTAESGTAVAVIPRGAVQNVADRTVVYLASAEGRWTFTEREVRLGQSSGGQVEVVSGLQPGDLIVTEGSFFIRAERERLGPRPAGATAPGAATGPEHEPAERRRRDGGSSVQTAQVIVSEAGFEPASVALSAGAPARLTFLRTTEKTCGTEVVFPSLGITRALPLNQPVAIEFTPAAGEIAFACGMNMLKGMVIVEERKP